MNRGRSTPRRFKGLVGQWHIGKRRRSMVDHEEQPPELAGMDAARSWKCRNVSCPCSGTDATNIRTHADLVPHSCRPTSAPLRNRFYSSICSSKGSFLLIPLWGLVVGLHPADQFHPHISKRRWAYERHRSGQRIGWRRSTLRADRSTPLTGPLPWSSNSEPLIRLFVPGGPRVGRKPIARSRPQNPSPAKGFFCSRL